MNIFWTNIESGLALIAACLPTLRLSTISQRVGSTLTSLQSLLTTVRSETESQRTDHESNHTHSAETVAFKNGSNVAYSYESHEHDHGSALDKEEASAEYRPR